MLQVSLFAREEESPSARAWEWPARSFLMADDLSICPDTWVWIWMATRHTDDTETDSPKAWDTSATLPWAPLLRM